MSLISFNSPSSSSPIGLVSERSIQSDTFADSASLAVKTVFHSLDSERAVSPSLSINYESQSLPGLCLTEILQLTGKEIESLKVICRQWSFYPQLRLCDLFGFYFHQAFKDIFSEFGLSREKLVGLKEWTCISMALYDIGNGNFEEWEYPKYLLSYFLTLSNDIPRIIKMKKLEELEKLEKEERSVMNISVTRKLDSLLLPKKPISSSLTIPARLEELQRKKREEFEEIAKKNRQKIDEVVQNVQKKIDELQGVGNLLLKILNRELDCDRKLVLLHTSLLSDVDKYIEPRNDKKKIKNLKKFAEYILDLFAGFSPISKVTVSSEDVNLVRTIFDTLAVHVSKTEILALRKCFMETCVQNHAINEKAALSFYWVESALPTYQVIPAFEKLEFRKMNEVLTQDKFLLATSLVRQYKARLTFMLFTMVEMEILMAVENYSPFGLQLASLLRCLCLENEPQKVDESDRTFSKPLPENFEGFFCGIMEPLEFICKNFFSSDEFQFSQKKVCNLEIHEHCVLPIWMEIFKGLHKESEQAANAIAKIYSEIPEKIRGYIKSLRESQDFKETSDDLAENVEDYILEKSIFVMNTLFIIHQIESIMKGTIYVDNEYPVEIEKPFTAIFASLKDLCVPLPTIPEAPCLDLSTDAKPALAALVEMVTEEQLLVALEPRSRKKDKKQESPAPTEKKFQGTPQKDLETNGSFSQNLPRSTRKLLVFLEKLGFSRSRMKGDHAILKLKGKGGQVVIPVSKDEQSLGTLKSIGRQAEALLGQRGIE